MNDFVDELERDLVAAARRLAAARRTAHSVQRRRFGGLPPALLAAGVIAVGASAAAAGTLTVLRGSPIPAPQAIDAGRTLTPVTGSGVLSPLRSRDPDGRSPEWTVRTARTSDGLVCTTAGQVVGGDFGIVGLDGRFRALAEGVVDGCGRQRAGASAVVGARVFDARSRAQVRTVVDGVGGTDLRRAELTVRGRHRTLAVGRNGAFVRVLAGYPEDLGLELRLRFASGRVERHALGLDRFVVLDPLDGPAWRALASGFGAAPGKPQYPGTCVSFGPARAEPHAPVSPSACGELDGTVRKPRGWFLAVRRLAPERCGTARVRLGAGRWCRGPARTAVWGLTGRDVRRVVVRGWAGGEVVAGRVAANGTTLAVLPATDPARLTVLVELTDGRRIALHGDSHLIDPPRED